jgi:hypothetical protein
LPITRTIWSCNPFNQKKSPWFLFQIFAESEIENCWGAQIIGQKWVFAYFKSQNKQMGKLWQRNYYEHIIPNAIKT